MSVFIRNTFEQAYQVFQVLKYIITNINNQTTVFINIEL